MVRRVRVRENAINTIMIISCLILLVPWRCSLAHAGTKYANAQNSVGLLFNKFLKFSAMFS